MWVKKGQQLYDTHHREVCEILNLISLFCQSAWGLLCFEWIFSLRWLCSVRCGVVWACPCLHSPKLLSFAICLTHPFIFCNLQTLLIWLFAFGHGAPLLWNLLLQLFQINSCTFYLGGLKYRTCGDGWQDYWQNFYQMRWSQIAVWNPSMGVEIHLWGCFPPAPDKSTLSCSYLKSKLRKVQIIQLFL